MLLGRADSDVASLTGRTDLWAVLWDYAMQRPVTGFGYGTFWTLDRISDVAGRIHWIPWQAHSAYLEVLLGLGLVGCVLYVVLWVLGVSQALVVPLDTRFFPEHFYLAAVMTMMLPISLSEGIVIREEFGTLALLTVLVRVTCVSRRPMAGRAAVPQAPLVLVA